MNFGISLEYTQILKSVDHQEGNSGLQNFSMIED